MIKLLAGLLGGRTWLAWLIAGGSVLAVLGGLYAWVDHGGYNRATLEWTVKYEEREQDILRQRIAEADRQSVVNYEAKQAERAAIEELERELADREALISRLQDEAAADPDATRLGINADAVSRINRIQ